MQYPRNSSASLKQVWRGSPSVRAHGPDVTFSQFMADSWPRTSLLVAVIFLALALWITFGVVPELEERRLHWHLLAYPSALSSILSSSSPASGLHNDNDSVLHVAHARRIAALLTEYNAERQLGRESWEHSPLLLSSSQRRERENSGFACRPDLALLSDPEQPLRLAPSSAQRYWFFHYLSAYPFLSGATFRSLADFPLDHLCAHQFRLPLQLQAGSVVFVKGRSGSRQFFDSLGAQQQSARMCFTPPPPFVLISHLSDESVELDPETIAALRHPSLVAWYAMNAYVTVGPDTPAIPPEYLAKLIPLPLGLTNRGNPEGDVDLLAAEISRMSGSDPLDRPSLVYVNMRVGSGKRYDALRREWIEALQTRLSPEHLVQSKTSSLQYGEYLRDLQQSKFVLCPPGNGWDTHRVWEALYMGAFPLVPSGPFDALYEDLPVLVVRDHSLLSEAFLQHEYVRLLHGSFRLEKLFAPYWFEHMMNSSLSVQEKALQSTISREWWW